MTPESRTAARQRLRINRWIFIVCMVLLVAGTLVWHSLPSPVSRAEAWCESGASGPLTNFPVRNFGAVDQGVLYRSAQPHLLALPWLRHYGIASIVNLRETQYDDWEQLLATLGFTAYLHLPMDNHRPPTEEEANAFLEFVQDQRHWPVLVHCAAGEGRTGALVALTRYAVDGWPMGRALEEAGRYEHKRLALSDAQRAWLAHWAQTHAAGDHRAG